MSGNKKAFLKIAGFQLYIYPGMMILGSLFILACAHRFITFFYHGISSITSLFLAGFCVAGYFMAIIFHEIAHGLAARMVHFPIRHLTILLFEGIAEIENEPENPRIEFFISLAGPVGSILLGSLFYLL